MTSDPLDVITTEAARRLLKSALDRFSNVGFHAATTREISQGAGMSPAALYVHFSSKEEMLFRLSHIGYESVLDTINNIGLDRPDPKTQLKELVTRLTIWHCQHHALGRVVHYEFDCLTPDHQSELSTLRRTVQEVVEGVIRSGISVGEFEADDVRDASRAIIVLCVDVVRWYRPGHRLTHNALSKTYADLAYRMLRP